MAKEKVLVFIILIIFYGISIPLTIYWLYSYRIVANTRHKCITSRHFYLTWGYLICCICASNIGYPLSMIIYCVHSNIRISIIISSYLLSDISTFSVCYMCLIRAYMMMWDKQYNLARKEQFWTKKIVNDDLETYESNDDIENNTLSPFIKYRRNLGNVKYVSVFMLCILAPITLFITTSPFIFIIHNKHYQLHHTLSSIFTIPIVSALVFIYFKIPKYNEVIGLRPEVRAIVQIICGTFLISNLLISFILYSITQLINEGYVMLINGNVQMISAFLLFYTSTGFILPRLNKIIRDDSLASNTNPSIPTKRRPFGLSTKLKLLFSWSNHNPNGPNLSSLSIPAFIADPTISTEKKLKKTLTIWRRRKNMASYHPNDDKKKESPPYHSSEHNIHCTDDDFSFIDGFDRKETASSYPSSYQHLLQQTHSESKFKTERPFDIANVGDGTEIEEIEEFDDDEVADNITDNEIDDIEIEIDGRNKGYSLSKHTSTTIGLQSTSPAFITPQISTTSNSKPHSRRTSSKFNPSELVNINTNTINTGTGTGTNTITLSGNAKSNNSNRSTNNSSRSTPIRRRHSLSVKDAYAGIKQIFGGHRNSMKSTSTSNMDDPEEKVYFSIKLEDPLNVVLSDQDGLSTFADHLCSEFSIENLLFIVEALQYRYCIPQYLFDEYIMDIDIEELNKTETVELLMHIIHQNKKLPISALLKQHRLCCIDKNKKVTDSPSRSTSSPDRESVDFMTCSMHEHDMTLTPIRRKSGSDKDKIDKCCKECTVEKFKYIIEKYVETTSINLPSATQRKLIHIWNEINIKDPEKRFVNKLIKMKKKTKKKKEKKKEVKTNNKICTKNNMDRENSKSIINKLKKKKIISIKKVDDDKKEEEKEPKPKQRMLEARQQTMSNTLQSEENLPSHSVSPRDIVIMPDIDVNVNSNVAIDRCVVASYSTNDTPSNIPVSTMQTSCNSHSVSHLTSTPITNNTTTTPTECDEEDEEPLPQSPTKKTTITQCRDSNEDQQMDGMEMAPTNSMQEMKGNGIWIPTKEDKKEEAPNDEQNEESEGSAERFVHDGFGNINFITVFDDAILEILKLIKSDSWRRFKRSKQFYDWATDFKPS